MSGRRPEVDGLHLVWLVPGSLEAALDNCTWLEPTRLLRESGWRVTLIAPGPAGVRFVRGTEVFCIPCTDVYLLRQILFHVRALSFLFRNWNTTNIVLFHQMSAPWILLLRPVRSALRTGQPLLVMDTRTVPMETKDRATLRDSVRGAFQGLMNRLANRWTDGQTAITPRMAEAVKIPEARLWGTWPSGVNLEEFASAQLVRQWPVGQEPVCLVYIGVLHYERNLMTLCRAVERANAHGMNFTLSLVGEGTERVALQEFALRAGGRISVVLPIPHDQVPALLTKAHVGVLPFPDDAKYRVSSPIKLFEYMGAGLPILATHIACHTDVIGNGQYVFWAQDASIEGLFEALCQLWRRRLSLHEMGLESASAASAWSWRASAQKLKTALEYGIALNQRYTQTGYQLCLSLRGRRLHIFPPCPK